MKAINFCNDSERCIVYIVTLVKREVSRKIVSENCNKTRVAKKKNVIFFTSPDLFRRSGGLCVTLRI